MDKKAKIDSVDVDKVRTLEHDKEKFYKGHLNAINLEKSIEELINEIGMEELYDSFTSVH